MQFMPADGREGGWPAAAPESCADPRLGPPSCQHFTCPGLCPSPARRLLQNEIQSALPKIVTAGFKAVRLIYYFKAGVQEVSV